MIGLLQRVSEARVRVAGREIARIGTGLLVLAAAERGDRQEQARRLADRLLVYRVFPDEAGRMNRSVRDIQGEILVVPQFTLAADTRRGTRPGFEPAAAPGVARPLFDALVEALRSGWDAGHVCTGAFGEDMDVALVNRGPVTFRLRVPPSDTPQ